MLLAIPIQITVGKYWGVTPESLAQVLAGILIAHASLARILNIDEAPRLQVAHVSSDGRPAM